MEYINHKTEAKEKLLPILPAEGKDVCYIPFCAFDLEETYHTGFPVTIYDSRNERFITKKLIELDPDELSYLFNTRHGLDVPASIISKEHFRIRGKTKISRFIVILLMLEGLNYEEISDFIHGAAAVANPDLEFILPNRKIADIKSEIARSYNIQIKSLVDIRKQPFIVAGKLRALLQTSYDARHKLRLVKSKLLPKTDINIYNFAYSYLFNPDNLPHTKAEIFSFISVLYKRVYSIETTMSENNLFRSLASDWIKNRCYKKSYK